MYRQLLFAMEINISSLRKRIIPILNFCQAKKGDLNTYNSWEEHDDAGKKIFYAYYSALFCRILYMIEEHVATEVFIDECNQLLDKYSWYDIQEEDLKLCTSAGPYGCEVPEALMLLDGIDNVAWKNSGFAADGRDAVCLKMEHASWTFADVRGSIHSSMRDRDV